MFVLTLTDDKLLKFVLIWGKVELRLFGGEKLGCPRTPFIILLRIAWEYAANRSGFTAQYFLSACDSNI